MTIPTWLVKLHQRLGHEELFPERDESRGYALSLFPCLFQKRD